MHPDRFAAVSRSLGDSTSRRGLLRLLGVGVAGTAITAVGLTEAQAERKKENAGAKEKARAKKARAQKAAEGLTTRITGTVNSKRYNGTFTVTDFAVQQGQLVALGTLSGAAAAAGQIALPVDLAQSSGTCEILTLVLGPLHLDILGLVIDLNQVVLEITAERGPGNLLGNLLCAIAGLLDGSGGALGQLANFLNDLLDLLG